VTEVWFRNPRVHVTELRDEGISRIVFSQTELGRQRHNGINLIRQIYAATPIQPQIMIIGKQGAQLYRPEDPFGQPSAVYPTWSPKTDRWDQLEELIIDPVGGIPQLCEDETVDRTMRPVFGQEHKVICYNFGGIPRALPQASKLQRDHPEVTLHINGLISFAYMYSYDFLSVDAGLEDLGDQNAMILLPPGKAMDINKPSFPQEVLLWRHWIELLGISIPEFLSNEYGQAGRYKTRIRSILWAQQHYNTNFKFAGRHDVLARASIAETGLPHAGRRNVVIQSKQYTTAAAEKILCDHCSIAPKCKVFRAGQICGLGESEMADLAKFFQHRDAGRIVEGLAELTKMRAERLETAMEKEAAGDELDPEVTKQMGGLFADGVKLAKLVDPKLSGAANVNVSVGVGVGIAAGAVGSSNPKELISAAVLALEEAGIPRNEIDGDMIKGMLKGLSAGGTLPGLAVGERMVHAASPAPAHREIEGTVVPEVPATKVA